MVALPSVSAARALHGDNIWILVGLLSGCATEAGVKSDKLVSNAITIEQEAAALQPVYRKSIPLSKSQQANAADQSLSGFSRPDDK